MDHKKIVLKNHTYYNALDMLGKYIIIKAGTEVIEVYSNENAYYNDFGDDKYIIHNDKCKAPNILSYNNIDEYRDHEETLNEGSIVASYPCAGTITNDIKILPLEVKGLMRTDILNDNSIVYIPSNKRLMTKKSIALRKGLYYVTVESTSMVYRLRISDKGFALHTPICNTVKVRREPIDILLYIFSHMTWIMKFKGYEDISIRCSS